jgi:hypothetical protein
MNNLEPVVGFDPKTPRFRPKIVRFYGLLKPIRSLLERAQTYSVGVRFSVRDMTLFKSVVCYETSLRKHRKPAVPSAVVHRYRRDWQRSGRKLP